MSTIHLVYAHENLDLAEKLTQQIGRIGIPFQHYTDRPEELPGQLAARVEASEGPVLLLITDNFLKNSKCMANALPMFQNLVRQKRVLTVVADGRTPAEAGQPGESVPTQFDRVVHAIQYMNHWQTAYLDMNNRVSDVPDSEKEQFERNLEAVRNIANEIGELFSALKDAGYYQWEQLEADHYALFFRHFNLQDWHAQYQELATLDHEAPEPQPQTVTQEARPIAETPTVPGPMAPAPSPANPAPESPQPESPATNGMDTPPKKEPEVQTPVEQLSPEPEPSAQELESPQETPEDSERRQRLIEKEIRQTIMDAGFWLERGYTERGLELFRVALEQHPQHEDLKAAYQDALEKHGDDVNGLDSPAEPAEKVEAKAPSEPEQTVSAPEPEKTLTSDPAQEASSYVQMGENAYVKGDYLLAKYCWDRVTELNPETPGIYRKLALLTSTHLTDYKETAAHYLEQALNAEPEDADLHYRLALLQRDHLDLPGKAIQHLREVVVLNPDHGDAWLALAQSTYDSGDHAKAESLYKHALEVDANLRSDALDTRFIIKQEETAKPVAEEAPSIQEPEISSEQIVEKAAPEVPSKPATEPLTVLITGATSGIGRATAERFVREGHRVILTGRRDERLEELKSHFQTTYSSEVQLLNFDVQDHADTTAALDGLPESWQDIDLLINNAGLAKGFAPIHEGDLEHWDTMIDTNIKGLLYVTRHISPGMVKRQKGHIINVGSIAGKEVYLKGNVYCATKFAVDALTKAIRLDLHSHNIRVSQVSPGHVEETEFALTRFDGDESKAKIYEDFQPLKASDVAEAIYFIATQPAYVNILDITLTGTQQANASVINRSGRQ